MIYFHCLFQQFRIAKYLFAILYSLDLNLKFIYFLCSDLKHLMFNYIAHLIFVFSNYLQAPGVKMSFFL
jgi:hypothetical protein